MLRQIFAFLLCLFEVPLVFAQGAYPLTAKDIPGMKFNHYFDEQKKFHDPDFEWSFTEKEFTIKKGKAGIPQHIAHLFLPAGITGEEISGKWTLDPNKGQIEFIEIQVDGKKKGRDKVMIGLFKSAPTVVRLNAPGQHVFAVERK